MGKERTLLHDPSLFQFHRSPEFVLEDAELGIVRLSLASLIEEWQHSKTQYYRGARKQKIYLNFIRFYLKLCRLTLHKVQDSRVHVRAD